jgi:hypothetical protein
VSGFPQGLDSLDGKRVNGVMRLDHIESGALDGAAYDPRTRTLTLKFESGGVYEYFDVEQELFDALERAQPHPWRVVGEEVKAHRYRRIG